MLDFVAQAQATQPAPRLGELARLIEERFGFHVHPRSIERALSHRKKPRPEEGSSALIRLGKEESVSHYEDLRLQALGHGGLSRGLGLAVLLREGMGSWIESWSKCVPLPMSVREGSTGTSAHSVPLELHGEIASILAGMALSYRRREVNT